MSTEILIIDDNADIRNILYDLIADAGYKTRVAANYNQALFSIHGALVCLGLILYSIGSKAIPAAELTLLSLTEVIGGIFWVWLPILQINEVPSNSTIIGGFLIFMSIIYYSLTIKSNRRFIALN